VGDAIDVVDPDIVVVEYNARFGAERSVTIPYSPNFSRSRAHRSNIYYGASLMAVCRLASRRGYGLVGCNSAGNNAFFVKRALICGAISECDPKEAFRAHSFREMRDDRGEIVPATLADELAILADLPLVEIS